MWFHLLSSGGLVYDPEPLCAFRCHAEQQTVINGREHVASAENIMLVSRYFDFFAKALGGKPNSFAVRQRLFRYLYYSRKDSSKAPAIEAAAAALRPRLGPAGYFRHWCAHRVIKPIQNISRLFLGKPVESRGAAVQTALRRAPAPPRPGPAA